MALSFLKTIEKPDDLRKIECLLNHITANKNYVKRIPLKHKQVVYIYLFLSKYFM